MSYTPYATSANAAGTTGQPSAVILKLTAGAVLTKNRIVTISGDDHYVCKEIVFNIAIEFALLLIAPNSAAAAEHTAQVVHWFEELRKKFPAAYEAGVNSAQ